MRKFKTQIILLFLLAAFSGNSQIIVSQDFEGPLTGWYNEGTVTGMQNSILPQAGSGMLSLQTNNKLESPTFSLPAGSKNVSFWMNSYNPYTFVTFSMELRLKQNGNSLVTLGTFTHTSSWTNLIVGIPAGYSGSNFSVEFHLLNYANAANLRFYLDEISVAAGLATSLSSNTPDGIECSLFQDPANRRLLSYQLSNEVQTVQVMSADGKIVCAQVADRENKLDLSNYPGGIYVIKFLCAQGIIVKKIII